MKNSIFLLFAFCLLLSNNQELIAQTEGNVDPYIWLEEVESERSLDWVKTQNVVSKKRITSNPLFKELEKKYLDASNDKDKIYYPNMVGDYVYNLLQDETYERGLWRRMLRADYLQKKTKWEAVLNLDDLSEKEGKKWVFDGATWLEPDNTVCLLALSDGGKDENEIREFNVETKEFIKGGFFFKESKGGVSWIDKNTLMVSRDFGEGTLTNSGYPRQVKILKRGESVENAKLVFETESTNVGAFGFSDYDNKKFRAFIYNSIAFYNSELYLLKGSSIEKVNYPKDAEMAGFHNNELFLSLQSDWNINDTSYPVGSLVSFNLQENLSGDFNIKVIYQPNKKSSFVSMTTTKDYVIVNVMENVQNKLFRYKLKDNKWISDYVNAPGFGSIHIISSSDETNDYFYLYSNFISPRTLYYANEKETGITKKLKDVFNAEELVVKQHFTPSKDGTLVPYYIVYKKDIELNGENPTLVYAYGGFNSSQQPNYSYTIGFGWLEQGGVYVLANIRGGGEFGPSWHKAGMKENKQNSYDDFYAVSEDLIAKKITSPEHLGAFGWSNGGLMAGVLFTQRPDLFNAVVVGAPLLDMKRYSKLLAGASWMGEYGNPDIPEEWEYIKKYSPYHNVVKDKEYPEVFFMTSTKDDRVHPGHARKMAAKMSDMGHPYLYHETIEGGHGAASTNAQTAYNSASIYTYLNMKLNKKNYNIKKIKN